MGTTAKLNRVEEMEYSNAKATMQTDRSLSGTTSKKERRTVKLRKAQLTEELRNAQKSSSSDSRSRMIKAI